MLSVLCVLSCGRVLPDAQQFVMPQIRSLTVTDVSQNGATLIASVSREDLLVMYGFTVEEASSGASRNLPASLEGDLITITLNDLQSESSYSFKAYIDNGSDLRVYSEAKSFTTLPAPPPETPDTPDQPDQPDKPDTPDQPGTPDQPDTPATSYIELPDANFRAWILARFDSDKDGRLSNVEAAGIGEIEIGTDQISTLSGLESFGNLVKLHAAGTRVENSGMGQLTALNLSGNPKLSTLYIPHNRIAALDLSPTPGLKQCEVCVNQLISLDVSMLKEVTLLNCGQNRLTRMDFRGLNSLDELHCEDNPLTEILLDNAVLSYIDCSNTEVQTLDFSRCPKLNIADCSGCKSLKTIYLAKGQVLASLRKEASVNIVYKDE